MKKEDLNLFCFEKFIGHSVYIKNEGADETFLYNNLRVDSTIYNCNCLVLIDGNNGLKTFIPFDSIYSISNIDDNLYLDIIEINAIHYDWKIGCAEDMPIPVKCDKCGHEFLEDDEQIWRIDQQGEYGSVFDGDWISKRLCDRCVSWLVDSD